jgi:ribonuclease HI
MADDSDLAHVAALERSLLDPSIRGSAERLNDLFHPEFVEYGASGRIWTRDAMITALIKSPERSGAARDLSAVAIADGVILLTYRIDGVNPSVRSSIWLRGSDQQWRIRFHQGTRPA